MIHPEEQPSTESVKRSGILMAAILFFTIAAIAVFGYIKSQGIDLKNIDIRQFLSGNDNVRQLNDEATNITEIPYDSNEHPVFGLYMDYIVKCSRDGVWLLDKKGQELWSVGVPLSNPMIKTNGKDLLVVDIGGRDIYVIYGRRVLWKDKTDETIQNAEINENGFVTVITSSKLYNGEVRVYDKHGIELMKSVIANDFAVTAKIAPSGDLMLINLINASNAKSYSYLKFFDMNGEEIAVKSMPQDIGLYPFVWFSKDDAIIAAGDTSIVFMDKDRNVKWNKQFPKISSVSVTGSKRIAAAVKNENVSELKVFTTAGQEYSSVQLDDEVVNMNAFGSIIAVNTGHKVSFMTERCKSIGIFTSRTEITGVHIFNKQQALVVSKSYISVVDIK